MSDPINNFVNSMADIIKERDSALDALLNLYKYPEFCAEFRPAYDQAKATLRKFGRVKE